jgi:hypothetical protein
MNCEGCQIKRNCYFTLSGSESETSNCPCKKCIVKAICKSQLSCGLRNRWVVEDLYEKRIKEYYRTP